MSRSVPTRKILWTRARNLCAFPTCDQSLTEDEVELATGKPIVTIVGEEAHIRSRKPDGPRHDPNYPVGKLDSEENLILLCPTHHTRIDAHNGAAYSVDDLVAMRERHVNQQSRRSEMETTIRSYLAVQYEDDNGIHFHQVDLDGPTVESMFVDVPFSCRRDTPVSELMTMIATAHPGDKEATEDAKGRIVTGAAQALLHPDWSHSGLLIGGPGQGKSTLLQYVCQFHRARFFGRASYALPEDNLVRASGHKRLPIRLDLRKYAQWASENARKPQSYGRKKKGTKTEKVWPSLEEFIVENISAAVPGAKFEISDLSIFVQTERTLIAFDGLDEVANLMHREQVSEEIVKTHARLAVDAVGLIVLVATRPGGATSALASSAHFPALVLGRLSTGLRLQYLQKWAKNSRLSAQASDKLQSMFLENQHVPHIRELASSPMQLAILLHLLYRRQLLPQQRTDLYKEYLNTFLDREQTEIKEPLLGKERKVIVDIHAYLAWYLQSRAEEGLTNGSIAREDLRVLVNTHLSGRADGQQLAAKLFSAISTRVLCLVERDPGYYQFEVQSLREYFAALYIFQNAPVKGLGNSRDDCLNALLERPYWSNVCRFLVGMLSTGEVRALSHNFKLVGSRINPHPMIRSMTALVLDDRTYEGVEDGTVQSVVDFILAGSGVVLADDGQLDVSGTPLILGERAGRAQAVQYLKARLQQELQADIRRAAGATLLRHKSVDDDVSEWWWNQYDSNSSWLETAADLRIFGSLDAEMTSTLADMAKTYRSDETWASVLLVRGDYREDSDELMAVVKRDLNEGAFSQISTASPGGTIKRLIDTVVLYQRVATTIALDKIPFDFNIVDFEPFTRGSESTRDKIASTASALRELTIDMRSIDFWEKYLLTIAGAWGDGWILRQVISLVPASFDLDPLISRVSSLHSELRGALVEESGMRENKGTLDWWRALHRSSDSEFSQYQWILGLLKHAKSSIVVSLSEELNALCDVLTPKALSSIETTLRASSETRQIRPLDIQSALRVNQITLNANALVLVRIVATESTQVRIDSKLHQCLGDMLRNGVTDRRPLLLALDQKTKVKVGSLKNARQVLPAGGWASDINLGAINYGQAKKIAENPEDWPSDVVQLAVERLSDQLAHRTKSIAKIAEDNKWFLIA